MSLIRMRNGLAIEHRPSAVSREAGERKASWANALPRADGAAMRAAFSVFAFFFDTLALLTVAFVTADFYHRAVYAWRAPIEMTMHIGALTTALFAAANLMRGADGFQSFLNNDNSIRRTLEIWTMSFLGGLAVAFLSKTSSEISRGAALLFYAGGGLTTIGVRAAMGYAARRAAKANGVLTRRVFLVGYEEELTVFSERYQPWAHGINIVSAAVLRGRKTLREDLLLAAASARIFRPDDIYILTPWHETETIDACIDAFMRIPAAIHLGPERVLDRFGDARIDKIGPIASLKLVRRPLSISEIALKRLFDLFAATCAVIVLSPLFLLVAVAIKLDSAGPAFFLQRRYGFNQVPFRIVKFRSLSTMEDNAQLRQVSRSDARITRVGRFIRRTNIDELPQLFNVILGDMSLVGPRPHALAHDQMFERSIALSARRHNVKPGITGWAQVNGLRGELNTEEKIRDRVEHDLYYIDNWSPWLDLRILFMTVFSRKAYANAY